jgi:hypothetical protein
MLGAWTEAGGHPILLYAHREKDDTKFYTYNLWVHVI